MAANILIGDNVLLCLFQKTTTQAAKITATVMGRTLPVKRPGFSVFVLLDTVTNHPVKAAWQVLSTLHISNTDFSKYSLMSKNIQ